MSRTKISLVGATLVAAVAGSASADVTYSFTNQSWTGLNFSNLTEILGGFTGTLTGVSVDATLNASTGFTYADDLTIYVDPLPLSGGGLLQVGGFTNVGATQYLSWANGASSAVGTRVFDTVSVAPISFAGTSSDPAIWLGNGYGNSSTAPTNTGRWTGSITLIGVNVVPAPGAMALLGVAGLVGVRRRRA